MTFVNLTPHTINVHDEHDAKVITLEPSGKVARVATREVCFGRSCGIPLIYQEKGETTGLPDPKPSGDGGFLRIFVVSTLVRLANPNRRDLASPGELVRDEHGRPVGCRGLVFNFNKIVQD